MAGTGFSFSSNSSPSFGFFNPSATSSAPSFGFGASTTSSTSSPSFGFGAPTTPSAPCFGFGATPTSSLFRSSSSGSGQTPSLFGANSSAAAPSSPSPSLSPFGTSTLFGSPAPRSANLFGSGAQTPSPFGSSSAAPTSSGTTTPLFGQGSTPAASLFAFPGATSTTSASSAPGFPFPTASTSPTPSFSLSAASSSSTSTTTTSGFSFNMSTTSSVSSSSASSGVSFGNTGLQSSAPLTSSVSKPVAFGTTPSSLFSTISTTTTTTASAPAATSAFSTASSAGSSASTSLTGLAFPASIGVGSAASAASTTSTSAPSSGFTGFGTLYTPASSSGSTSSFSLSLKSSTAAASSAPQSQSTAALPSLAVASTNASNSTSTSTSAAQISSAIVASSSGTIATTTTVVASSPKLPSEITGRTVEEDILNVYQDMETTESPPVIGEQLVEENRAPLLEPANEPNNPSVEFTSVDANPHSEVNLTTSEDTLDLSASACRTAEDVSEPQTNQPFQSPSITAQQIINIGAGIQVQKGFSNALDDPSLLDERSLSVQIQEIGTFKTVRSGGVSHSALIPASNEPDGVSWNLGLGTILPGEIEKIKDLSPLQLVQSTFKHIELAKHQIAQLGIQNEDGFFAQSITNTKLDNIAAAHRALMVDVESLRAENEKLLKSNAEIATEKESILKEKDDLCLLIKNMENALQTQIEKAKKSQFDAGFAYGYKQRTQEILTYLGHATSPDQEL